VKILIEGELNTCHTKIICIEDDEERDNLIDSLLEVDYEDESPVKDNIDLESNIAIRNALNLAEEMKSMISHIPYAKQTLKTELSVLDKAQEDILSKIESVKFNVVDGYQLIKQLKEIRIKRRTVKNNLFVYESLDCMQIPKEKVLDDVVLRARNIEGEVKYKPRVLTNIEYKFNDNKNSKFKDIKKEDLLSLEF
ncbi:MAG: hypothetical protein IJH34_05050, partial [Romboutsia sp.]|nr:hypothetical protein [Romboutsia sp.]